MSDGAGEPSDAGLPAFDLDAVRLEIPLLERLTPLNACSQAPQARRVRAAAHRYLESWERRGMVWDAWIAEVEAAREAFAALVGGAPEEVAVGASVSQLTASVASALDYARRPRVVVSAAEFPAVAHVWRAQSRHGAEVVTAGRAGHVVRLSDYEGVVDDRTCVVSACHGAYQTGQLQDIPSVADRTHERGALLFVDAYQTLGAVPLDAPSSGADFVAAGALKYLMGAPGIAFLWVRPEVAERLEPTVTGWFGRRDPFAFDPSRLDWAAGARRFDLGTPPVAEAYVARAALEWLLEVGPEAIAGWVAHLTATCVREALARRFDVLGPIDPAERAPSTPIRCRDANAMEARLRERGVLSSARGPAIRLAPHFYNTEADVLRALDALGALMAG